MRPYDIVAYTYRADTYGPECIMDLVAPGFVVYADELPYVEAGLDVLAAERGIDREDERSFDSGDFPKVIFRDQFARRLALRVMRCIASIAGDGRLVNRS